MAILVALDHHFHLMNLKWKKGDPLPSQASAAEGGSSIQLSPKLCKMIVRFIC